MADLQKTQAEWSNFFREFTEYLIPIRKVVDLQKQFTDARVRALEQFEVAGVLSTWTIVGAKRNVNCTEGAQLFVDLKDEQPSAGEASVQLYKDAGMGAGDLVASGSGPNGTTVTLAAKNSSVLTGSVLLGTIAASSSAVILNLEIDESLKAENAFATDRVGKNSKNALLNILNTSQGRLGNVRTIMKTDLEQNFIRTRMKEFLKSATTTIISVTETTDDNDDALLTFTGLLNELDDAMNDDSVVQQFIVSNTVTTTAAEFDPDNTGSGTLTIISTRESAINGTVTAECTSGKANTLEEEFAVTMVTDREQSISAPLTLVVGKEFESSAMGVRFKIARTITDINDGSNQVSNYVINGETLANTDAGVIYQDLIDTSGTRSLTWYSDAARTAVVASGTSVGDGTVTMVALNGSGLSGSADVAYTTDDTDIQIILGAFAEGDKIAFDMTNDEKGIIQTTLRDLFLFSLQSGAATISDDFMKEGVDHFRAVS